MIKIRANNPSPLTGEGTNSFLIGPGPAKGGGYALIDPGPDLAGHRQAILDAAEGRIEAVLVTHAHLDHSEGAHQLAAAANAPVLAFGGPDAGRSALMKRLGTEADMGGGEGLDYSLKPDRIISDGEVIEGTGWTLTAFHMPGHAAGHMCFMDTTENRLFSGDLVFDWSSTMISPPDGDLTDYFRSLARIQDIAPAALIPAHGGTIPDPKARINELAAHRRQRTAQILESLRTAPGDAETIARRIYDVPPALLPAASRNVLAHLLALADIGAVTHGDILGLDSVFHTKAEKL